MVQGRRQVCIGARSILRLCKHSAALVLLPAATSVGRRWGPPRIHQLLGRVYKVRRAQNTRNNVFALCCRGPSPIRFPAPPNHCIPARTGSADLPGPAAARPEHAPAANHGAFIMREASRPAQALGEKGRTFLHLARGGRAEDVVGTVLLWADGADAPGEPPAPACERDLFMARAVLQVRRRPRAASRHPVSVGQPGRPTV